MKHEAPKLDDMNKDFFTEETKKMNTPNLDDKSKDSATVETKKMEATNSHATVRDRSFITSYRLGVGGGEGKQMYGTL